MPADSNGCSGISDFSNGKQSLEFSGTRTSNAAMAASFGRKTELCTGCGVQKTGTEHRVCYNCQQEASSNLLIVDAMRLRLPSTAALGAALAMSTSALAQQNDANTPPPPQMEVLEEGVAPATTIRRQGSGKNTITEERTRGRVTGIRVERGDSTYFIEPKDPTGSALPGDTQAPTIRAPQWRVFEFDMKPPEERRPDIGDVTADPLPPPSPPQ